MSVRNVQQEGMIIARTNVMTASAHTTLPAQFLGHVTRMEEGFVRNVGFLTIDSVELVSVVKTTLIVMEILFKYY